MNRFGSIAFVVTVTLLCAVALSASPALAAASTAHRGKPAVHRVGGKVHKAWPRSGKPPRSALARQVGPTKVRACTKRLHGKVVKCHRKQAPRRGAPLPGAQLGGPKGHSADAAGAFMRIGDDVHPIAYAAASSHSSSGSSGSSGSAKS
jgi:hypothetical protein